MSHIRSDRFAIESDDRVINSFFLLLFCEMSLPRIIRGKLKKREKNPVERVCRCRIISLKVPGFEG